MSRFVRFLGSIALLASLIGTGVWWFSGRSSAGPLARGLDAYARGDWETAAGLARRRLKSAANDTAALRLLARASVRLGRDSTAMAVYDRLGSQTMAADDLCLLGIALTRSGNAAAGLEVWEQAHSAEPDHAETLWELTLAYSASDRLSEAGEIARRLAVRPGWKARAEALLVPQFNSIVTMSPVRSRTGSRLARTNRPDRAMPPYPSCRPKKWPACSCAQRPREARHELNSMLALGPDQEAFWMLSRAFLQEGAKGDAQAACEKAGSFRDDNPLVAEPAPYVGSERCVRCHSAIYHAQQGSRHARTFFRAGELKDLELPAPSFSDPARPDVTHTIQWMGDGRLQQSTNVEGQIKSAIVQYAFGTGDRGLTLVGRDQEGQSRELRLSRYSALNKPHWSVTAGQTERPSATGEFLGRPLSDDGVRRCLLCHVTSPRAIVELSGPCSSDRGIGCEKCHGPGGNHLLAIDSGLPDKAIVNPAVASGLPVVKLCGQCHSPRGGDVLPSDPASVRFQATTLTWSRCFTESQNQLDCTTCHDPHRNASTASDHYEGRCLTCHSGPSGREGHSSGGAPAESSGPLARLVCPVNPTALCIACHMPAVKNAIPHSSFTDHHIRVHRD